MKPELWQFLLMFSPILIFAAIAIFVFIKEKDWTLGIPGPPPKRKPKSFYQVTMTTIKAQVEIDIFDDPEKCGKCPQLDDERGPWLCGWSRQYLEEDEQQNPIKCDQCKAAYQAAIAYQKHIKTEAKAHLAHCGGFVYHSGFPVPCSVCADAKKLLKDPV